MAAGSEDLPEAPVATLLGQTRHLFWPIRGLNRFRHEKVVDARTTDRQDLGKGLSVRRYVPKTDLMFKCRKCRNGYPATVTCNWAIEDLDENQSLCPFCGERDCADPRPAETTMSDVMKEKEQLASRPTPSHPSSCPCAVPKSPLRTAGRFSVSQSSQRQAQMTLF
jgi:hypothetical protein